MTNCDNIKTIINIGWISTEALDSDSGTNLNIDSFYHQLKIMNNLPNDYITYDLGNNIRNPSQWTNPMGVNVYLYLCVYGDILPQIIDIMINFITNYNHGIGILVLLNVWDPVSKDIYNSVDMQSFEYGRKMNKESSKQIYEKYLNLRKFIINLNDVSENIVKEVNNISSTISNNAYSFRKYGKDLDHKYISI